MEGSHIEEPERSTLDAAPGLARLAAGAWLRTAAWTIETTARAGRRATRVAAGRESAVELVRDAGQELLEGTRRLLGVTEIERRIGAPRPAEDAEPLRQRGAELLDRSTELDEDRDEHPAYGRILEQLSPDEARIVRLLATGGPQPAVDVRTWRPLDFGSRVVAPGLSMLARHAGVMHPDRVPAYLSNLFRLGLIWFSREQLPDLQRYQVLEAQPDVIEAMKRAGRGRTVRRSIHLTPFGEHFCEFCMPLDTAELEALG